jgi:hypothetical protein
MAIVLSGLSWSTPLVDRLACGKVKSVFEISI